MSKTIEIQIEKSRNLIGGLKKHLTQGGSGITTDEIAAMEQSLEALATSNEECDRLRAELSVKVKNMNQILATVKGSFAENKKMIKGLYPQERWIDYGVPDKR